MVTKPCSRWTAPTPFYVTNQRAVQQTAASKQATVSGTYFRAVAIHFGFVRSIPTTRPCFSIHPVSPSDPEEPELAVPSRLLVVERSVFRENRGRGTSGTTGEAKGDRGNAFAVHRVAAVSAKMTTLVTVTRRESDTNAMVMPQQPVPTLDLPVVGGVRWSVTDQEPEAFTLVVFYRGFHCPVCRGYLKQLQSLQPALKEIGVSSVVAVSGDDQERATATVEGWELTDLPVAYGQTVGSMREWGLFVSTGLNEGEPALFGEPGLFLIRADGTLYASVVNSMPFGRPHLDEIVGAVRWVKDNSYPARGEA
jgi:peroxiredoxin